jgi:hypothetical protein
MRAMPHQPCPSLYYAGSRHTNPAQVFIMRAAATPTLPKSLLCGQPPHQPCPLSLANQSAGVDIGFAGDGLVNGDIIQLFAVAVLQRAGAGLIQTQD